MFFQKLFFREIFKRKVIYRKIYTKNCNLKNLYKDEKADLKKQVILKENIVTNFISIFTARILKSYVFFITIYIKV